MIMADDFDSQLARFSAKLDRRVKDVFVRSTEEVQQSVVEGSAVTGAPGQPVDTGNLKTSWIGAHQEPMVWRLATNVAYAPIVEEGGMVGGAGRSGAMWGGRYTLRSEVGGFHSLALTRAGWQRIVTHAVREVSE